MKKKKKDLGDGSYAYITSSDGKVSKAIIEGEDYISMWIRKKYQLGEFMDPEEQEIMDYEYGSSKPITDEFLEKKRKCHERLENQKRFLELVDAEFVKLGKEFVIDSREGHDDIVYVDGIGDVWASRLKGWAFPQDTPEENMFTPENDAWVNWEYDNGKLTIIIEED